MNKFIKNILEEANDFISPPNIPNTMNFFHGGNLDEYNDVIAQKNGRYEYGPGLYLTNEYSVAKKYAKGNRKLYLITVEKGNDINDVVLSYQKCFNFIKEFCISKKLKEIILTLKEYEQNETILASIFNNIILNHKAIMSTKTKYLRQFLIDNDIDYELISSGYFGNLMVLYNMQKIKNIIRIKSTDKLTIYTL